MSCPASHEPVLKTQYQANTHSSVPAESMGLGLRRNRVQIVGNHGALTVLQRRSGFNEYEIEMRPKWRGSEQDVGSQFFQNERLIDEDLFKTSPIVYHQHPVRDYPQGTDLLTFVNVLFSNVLLFLALRPSHRLFKTGFERLARSLQLLTLALQYIYLNMS